MSTERAPSARNLAIDVARGIAVVLMIQTHAYDGWVRTDERTTLAYRITRFLGVLPLPTFLLLAGVGTALRIAAAEARGEPRARVRRDFTLRGLEVVLAGYAVSALLGLIDGATRAETFLRIDVLHAIGASILVSAWGMSIGRGATSSTRGLATRGLLLAGLAAGLSIPGTHLGREATGALRFILAPFVEVPGITRMPLIPLVAWLGLGTAFGALWLGRARSRTEHLLLALGATVVAVLASLGTTALHEALGGTLDRTHPAIVLNVVDLGARAVALVATFLGLVSLPSIAGGRATGWLNLLGRHSLLAYAVHLPFAYGRIAHAFARTLGMPAATLGVVALVLGTAAVVFAKSRFDRWRMTAKAAKAAKAA